MSIILSPYRFAATGDPYWTSVKLLMHFDGTDGASTTTDSSSSAKTVHLSSGVLLTTAQQKYGTASVRSGVSLGGGASRAWVADSADWSFGSGQFTVEGYFRFATVATNMGLISQLGNSGQYGWDLYMASTTSIGFLYSTTGSDFPLFTGAWTPTTNTWYHIAVDRDASNVIRVYVDGVVKASATVSSTFFDSNAALDVGNDERLYNPFDGWFDEVRITKGVARYGGAFTPPTAAFPNA
jgi:hypothetical protein